MYVLSTECSVLKVRTPFWWITTLKVRVHSVYTNSEHENWYGAATYEDFLSSSYPSTGTSFIFKPQYTYHNKPRLSTIIIYRVYVEVIRFSSLIWSYLIVYIILGSLLRIGTNHNVRSIIPCDVTIVRLFRNRAKNLFTDAKNDLHVLPRQCCECVRR